MTTAARQRQGDPGARRALITKIHLAKRVLGLDDGEYRALLQGATGGKGSCAELSVAELAAVLNACVQAGWYPGPARSPREPRGRTWIEVPRGIRFERQVKKACAMAVALGWDLDGLNKRMKRQFGVDHIFFVADQAQMQTLIKDLVNRCKRAGIDPYPELRG